MLNEGKRFASPGSCSDKDWTICSFNSLSLAVICVFKIKHESYTPPFFKSAASCLFRYTLNIIVCLTI